MGTLRDLRAERLGLRVPGSRAIDPFPQTSNEGGPELDELFRLTRPDKTRTMVHAKPNAYVPMTPPPLKHAAPVVMQKAMTRYPRKVAPR